MKLRLFGIFAAIVALAFTACGDLSDITKSDLTGDVTLNNHSPKVGDTITATYEPGNGSGAQTWQWFRADGNDVPISGAAAGAYTVTADDIGSRIRVKVSFADQNNSQSAITTNAVAAAASKNTDITYTLAQIGGIDKITDTTGILFTFSEPIDSLNLTADDITVSGAAQKGSARLSGEGITWALAPITVNSAEQAAVLIVKPGIYTETMHVGVFKAGKTAATLTGITAVYDETIPVHPHTELDSLKSHLTVKAVYSSGSDTELSPNEYDLEGDLSQYGETTITVTYKGTDATCVFTVTVVTDTSITKTDPDVTWPTGLKAAFGQTLADIELDECVNFGGQPGAFSWTTPTNSVGDLGERTHNMTFTPEDLEDYNIVSGDVTITVIEGCVTHTWGEWVETLAATVTVDGVGTNTCTVCNAKDTRPLWATGTEGLTYVSINGGAAYRVYRNYTDPVTQFPTLHIPAYHRPDGSTDYEDYKPVTEIGSISLSYSSSSFGGTSPDAPNTTLTSLTFAEDREPTVINSYAFYNCTNITELTIPANVTIVNAGTASNSPGYAFANCTGLTSVTLKEGATISGIYTFAYCTGITSLIFSSGVTINKTTNNNKFDGSYAFRGCTGLTEVTIPSGVTINADSVFQDCTGLTSVTISADVTGDYMFNGCTNLTSVTLNEGITSIGAGMFQSCTNLASITFPASVTSIGVSAFYGTGFTTITIPAGVTFGGSAFRSCTGLTNVIISEGVTTINPYMFYSCSSLTTITIPESVTSIENYAFYGCTSLTSIDIPSNVTSIGTYAFRSTSLTSITIPANVTSIGNNAFNYCTNLASVTFESTIASGSFGSTTPFLGSLRAKFYATDPANGTPGTYTTTAPVSASSVWELQEE